MPKKGYKHSKETKQKLRESGIKFGFQKGNHYSPKTEFKKGNKINLGRKLNEEIKKKISLAKKGQIPWCYGKKLSEEHKRKISISHKGKKQTEEHKINISNALKGKIIPHKKDCKCFRCTKIPWNKGKKGVGYHGFQKGHKINIGKKCTNETKRKIGLANKGRKRGTPSQETIQKIREAKAKYIFPFKNTSIELMFQNELIKRGILFEKHKAILGQPDIFISPNICIFIDGCYWHCCEQCFDRNKFIEKQRLKIIYDLAITQKLQNEGYKVFRFWEHDIKKNVESCVNNICFNLQEVKK